MTVKFLNSEQAKEEEKSNELLSALNRIAVLEARVISLTSVLSEMALENARIRVELAFQANAENGDASG